tara:strand:- start:1260 stop:2009 length:750 start_codon:yes stop_codon:yes gene_type:complete
LKKSFIFIILFLNSCETEIQDSVILIEKSTSSNQSQNDIDGDGILDDLDLDNNTRQGAKVDENGVMENPIYLDENGITIKAKEWSISGDTGLINEIEYEVISEEELRIRILNNENITRVCTSKINSFSWLFLDKNEFNQDIKSWDTSNVTAMNFMFYYASSFNQNIENWDTSNVNDMNFMFWEASEFNVDIRLWDTSKVTIMRSMFNNASSFNKDLSGWDVLKVNDCQLFFNGATNWTLPKPSFTICSP